MLATALLLMLPAFAALALAMDRHHETLAGHPPSARRRRRLRAAAGMLLATALASAVHQPAPAQALVDLVVAASVAALAVCGTLTLLAPGSAPARPVTSPAAARRSGSENPPDA